MISVEEEEEEGRQKGGGAFVLLLLNARSKCLSSIHFTNDKWEDILITFKC